MHKPYQKHIWITVNSVCFLSYIKYVSFYQIKRIRMNRENIIPLRVQNPISLVRSSFSLPANSSLSDVIGWQGGRQEKKTSTVFFLKMPISLSHTIHLISVACVAGKIYQWWQLTDVDSLVTCIALNNAIRTIWRKKRPALAKTLIPLGYCKSGNGME